MLVMTPDPEHLAHAASDNEDQRPHHKTNPTVYAFGVSVLPALHAELLAQKMVIAWASAQRHKYKTSQCEQWIGKQYKATEA